MISSEGLPCEIKMKTENVSIQLTSFFEEMESQTRSLQGKMTRSLDERSVRLMYIQQMEEDRMPETAVWEFDEQKKPVRLIVSRPGANYRLVFDPQNEWESGFDSPAGVIKVKIAAEKLTGTFDDLCWSAVYRLTLAGQDQGRISIEYRIHPV